MFFVNDTQERRHKFIMSFLKKDTAPIAILLAAIDFEWTVKRTILAFGTSPTKNLRACFKNVYGLRRSKEKWKEEVQPRLGCSIDRAIPQWSQVHEAFAIRDKIIHGASVPVTLEYATPHVNSILGASESLEKLAQTMDNNRSLYQRRIRRRNPWSPHP
jgi:hypothetical protein